MNMISARSRWIASAVGMKTTTPMIPHSVTASSKDLRRVGVTLAGHQKKILNSIQEMRVQMMNATMPI